MAIVSNNPTAPIAQNTGSNEILTVAGVAACPGAILSTDPTAGVGYGTGAGGQVTQATNKSTGVTLNKIVGAVTMVNSSLADATTVTFTVTNSAVAANDTPYAYHKSAGTGGAYVVQAHTPAAGSFKISVRNVSGGSLSEAIVVGFEIRKGVVA